MMSDALKPCPFCGGHNVKWNITIQRDPFAECLGCTATVDGSIAAWNTRAAPRVKPLVWDRMDEARGGMAKYIAYETTPNDWNCVCYPHDAAQCRLAEKVTKEAAKAAAQADYTARILAALEAPPQNTLGGLAGGLAETPNCHEVESNRESEE